MIKNVYPDSHERLLEAAGGRFMQLVEERVKSAASEVFSRQKLASFAPPPGKFGVHVVSMGADEWYGPNRNGDGFPEQALIDYHPTFEKYAHFYREHRNKDPKTQGIGDVKAAAYNPTLHRGELFLWGDREKAEEEYELLKQGKEISVSMSVRLPHDVCSCCRKKSASVREYCPHLREHMLQWLPEFNKYAYAINDHKLKFFDISRVRRPADRIAHYLEAMFPDADEKMAKAASAGNLVIPGAAWAEFDKIAFPYDESEPWTGEDLELMRKIAAVEEWLAGLFSGQSTEVSHDAEFAWAVKRAFADYREAEELDQRTLDKLRVIRPQTLFRELAKRATILPFRSFCAYALNRPLDELSADEGVKEACSCGMGSMMRSLLDGGMPGGLSSLFGGGSELASDMDAGKSDEIDMLLDDAAEKFSVEPGQTGNKVITITIKLGCVAHPIWPDPDAPDPSEDFRKMANIYGVYQFSALRDMQKLGHELDRPLLISALARNFFRENR